jgi:glycosyltransferase involved in cell wall biosynthesis
MMCSVEGGITVYRLPYTLQWSNTRIATAWLHQLRRIIRIERPDIINAHTPVPGMADAAVLVAGRVPLVVTYHAGSMRKGRFLPDVAVWWYEHLVRPIVLRRPDRIIATSDFVNFGVLGKPRSAPVIITPGVDPERFTPADELARDSILFVGGLNHAERHKALEELLGTFARLLERSPSLRLEVAGTGDRLAQFREIAHELDINEAVTFLGRIEGQDLASAYRRATVLAVPSYNDNFPTVILEAMASGVPVVASTIGAIPSLVDHGNTGLLIPVRDQTALLDSLHSILSNRGMAVSMGRESRARLIGHSFTEERLAASTTAVFQSLIEQMK